MKKRISLALVIIMCLSVILAACSGESGDANSNGGGTPQGGQTVGGNTGTPGKYVQQEVTPPQLKGGYISQIRQMPDGRILAVGNLDEQMPVAYATHDGSVWEELYPLEGAGILNDYPEHRKTYTVDDDGIWWIAAYTEAGDDNHLFKIQSGSHEEITIGIFVSRQAGNVMEILPGTDGTILLCTMVPGDRLEWTVVNCEAGKETSSFKAASFYPSYTGYHDGKVYAYVEEDNGTVYTFNAATGKQEANHPMPEGLSISGMPVGDISDDGAFACVNTSGIHKVALGGSYLQTVTDSRSYAFADSTNRLSRLCAASDDSYWMVCYPALNLKLYRYVFDANAPVVAAERLYIWTMEDNALLKLAVSTFAQQNPDSEVVVEVGHSVDNAAQTDEDIIRALNTQMLAGDVPDLLILDGLPIESMIKQGMLTDLSGIVNESDYYENILSCYSQDGKVWAYPSMFWVPALIQSSAANDPSVSDMRSLEDMQTLLTQPDQLFLGGYYHLFSALYAASAPSIFPGGNSVDENALHEFLSITKAAVDAHGIEGQEYAPGWEEVFSTGGADDFVIMISPSLGRLNRGEGQGQPYAAGILYDYFNSINMTHNYGGDPAATFAPMPGNTFIPKCIVGVPVGATNSDAGKQFVKILLECQTLETIRYTSFPGFLVRKGIEMQQAVESAEAAESDPNVPWDFPNPKNTNIEELIASLRTPSCTDDVLESKVYEQAGRLYMGHTDLDAAVAAVLQNTELYFDERQ